MFTTAVAIRSRFTRGITSVYRTRNLSNFLPESLCLGKSESFESNSYNTAYPRKFLFQIFFPFSLFKEKRRRRISKILPSFQKLTRKATRTFFELSNLPERIKIESLSLSLHRRIFATLSRFSKKKGKNPSFLRVNGIIRRNFQVNSGCKQERRGKGGRKFGRTDGAERFHPTEIVRRFRLSWPAKLQPEPTL